MKANRTQKICIINNFKRNSKFHLLNYNTKNQILFKERIQN